MTQGIYRIRNLTNGKCYVGSSVTIEKRWANHRWQLKSGNHHSAAMQSAWNKYGQGSFAFEIIEVVASRDDLVAAEQRWLDHCHASWGSYSLRTHAESNRGFVLSEETKRRISEKHRQTGHRPSPVAAEKARVAAKGSKLSLETRAKMSAAHRGRKRSAQEIANWVAANTGKKRTPEARERMRASRPAYYAAHGVSDATREKLRRANVGKKMSPEAIERSRQANIGLRRSEETKAKLRAARAAYLARRAVGNEDANR